MSEMETVPRLPFGFAQRHGVILVPDETIGASVLYKSGLTTSVLAEVRRFAGVEIECREVDGPTFDRTLSSAYQDDTGEAMQMIEDLGDEMDLGSIADLIP